MTVRHSGPITLAYLGNRADLDSPASDPQWQTDDIDVEYGKSNSKQVLRFQTPVIRMGSTEADYGTCRNTTGYWDAGSYDTGNIAVGDYFCVKTSEGRYSAVKFTGVTDQRLSLDVVTYDPPGD